MLNKIESFKNEKIRHLIRLLEKNRERRSKKLVIVEGRQENQRAQSHGYTLLETYICPDFYPDPFPTDGKVYEVTPQIYQRIAYRGTTEGIIGIYSEKNLDLNEFTPPENTRLVIVDRIEKPGNLGAILRSCEAFGIDALILTDPLTDIYNPNVIRSSVGCLFGMPVFITSPDDCLEFLSQNNIPLFTTFMTGQATKLSEIKFTKAAVAFGTEHSGLSDFWKGKGENLRIPMQGSIDSLNLSNAVAITCYQLSLDK